MIPRGGKVEEDRKIKAVILAAGMGSRISPLTDSCPKPLLKVGGKTLLGRLLSHIRDAGIRDVVMVLGCLEAQIKDYVRDNFPDLNVFYAHNYSYAATNTAFSFLLAENFIGDSPFIKFDADVVFEPEILARLIASPHANCLCIDKSPGLAAERIGMEKISGETAPLLFMEIREIIKDPENYQKPYEEAYESLVKKAPFHALDITGLKWKGIDTKENLAAAEAMFRTPDA
jgi:choline kinase